MTKELQDSLKNKELSTFVILYALRQYRGTFNLDKDMSKYAETLNGLIEKYDKKATDILIKKNLIGEK